jgi:hypothetical protein
MLFGSKQSNNSSEKGCPFTFSLVAKDRDKNNLSRCVKDNCQLWDEQRNDCGLKQK